MNRFSHLARLSATLALATSLSACITLFPTTKSAQLYRFQAKATESTASAPASAGPKVNFIRAGGSFTAAASGDRILTVSGPEAAYIAHARWMEPAEILFNQALRNSFSQNRGPARLLSPGEPGRPDLSLRLDISRFDVDYDHGARQPPTVCIDLHGVITRLSGGQIVRDKSLTIRVRARSNQVSAIIVAFQAAVETGLSQVMDLANDAATAPNT